MADTDTKTLFLGAGNMARAILAGFKDSGGDMGAISVVDPFADEEMVSDLGLLKLYRDLADIDHNVTRFDTIVVAVKPQIFETFESGWADVLADDGTVISIMAGVPSEKILAKIGKPASVVRCMPNMAAAVGRSVNVAYTKDACRKDLFESLFQGSGPVSWIEQEDEIHLTTALSGSGPAYFFAFVEALAAAGENAGLTKRMSLDLSIDTMIGAAELLKNNRAPQSLREGVTSKGGTTAAALSAFGAHDNLNAIVQDAVDAAIERSHELAS